VATPDPYHHWSGAPKHWVQVPAQRSGPPAPDELEAAAARGGAPGRARNGQLTVAAIALALLAAAFALLGTGGAVTGAESAPPEATPGSVSR